MNTTTQQPRRTSRGHLHTEAFCLMWYRCPCSHMERIWNTRDGVTPFCTQCPSCGAPELQHVYFGSDTYAPDHKPAMGQRCWVSMTQSRAKTRAIAYIESLKQHRRLEPGDDLDAILESLIASFYGEGCAPDLQVFGYQEAT